MMMIQLQLEGLIPLIHFSMVELESIPTVGQEPYYYYCYDDDYKDDDDLKDYCCYKTIAFLL